MPIWKTAPVSEQPELTLIRWKVFETPEGDRHFVGYCCENREGRVSTAIVEFDHEIMRGRTRSGRVYQLKGPDGHNMDAMYVWGCWKSACKIENEKDVSREIWTEEKREAYSQEAFKAASQRAQSSAPVEDF